MNNTLTCLVTGGAGFLGSHLVDRLVDMGHKVICLDNEFRGSFENISNRNSDSLKIKKGDVRNIEDWPEDEDIDAIFHLAAINGTPNFYSIPDQVLDVNIFGTKNALEFARKKNINYFSFASSPEAYGKPKNFPTPESEELVIPDVENPRWSYGASKALGEIYCSVYSKKYGFKCSILRYHNTYGPRDFEGHVIPDTIRQILERNKVVSEGTGKETRSFCYVDDAIDATLLIQEKQRLDFAVFNVGNDKETKICDLLEKIISISGKKISPEFVPKKLAGTNRRKPALDKLRKLGFESRISLDQGLENTFVWLKNRIN